MIISFIYLLSNAFQFLTSAMQYWGAIEQNQACFQHLKQAFIDNKMKSRFVFIETRSECSKIRPPKRSDAGVILKDYLESWLSGRLNCREQFRTANAVSWPDEG